MIVGTIVELKRECLGNLAGVRGVVFYDYGDGFQAIFENGNYDGFSTDEKEKIFDNMSEADFILKEVGFEPELVGYQFQNVMQLTRDFEKGIFDKVWGGSK